MYQYSNEQFKFMDRAVSGGFPLTPDLRVVLARYNAARREPTGVLATMRANDAARQANVKKRGPGRQGVPRTFVLAWQSRKVDPETLRTEWVRTYERAMHGAIGNAPGRTVIRGGRQPRHARAHEQGLTRSGFQAKVSP